VSGADATGTGPRAEVARLAARAAALRHRVHADALDELAAAVAYHAFLALLPLLLLATAAAGLVLADGAARSAVTDAVVGAVPALELATLPGGPLDTALAGVAAARGSLGLLGGAGLVLAGVRLGSALMAGVTAAFRTPRPRGAVARLREAAAPALLGLLALTGVGVGAVAGGVRAALVPLLPGPLPGPTLTAVAAVAATGLDALVVAGLFRLLVPRAGTLRSHLAGAVVVAAGWGALRVLGGAFVGTRIAAAGAVWGALAGVVTVLVLLHLLARLLLVGALVSALRHERSTP
jgi:membrane protein